MALTRKMLKAMGIEDEKIDQIIEAHTETVESLKKDRDGYKEKSERVAELESEIENLKDDSKNKWKTKYDALKEEFDGYKDAESKKAVKAAKQEAYKKLLKKAGVSEKRMASVIKVSDIDSIELNDEGNIKGADELEKTIKSEWSDFIVTTGERGADTSTPPANTGGSKMSKEEILAIKDTAARQKAMYENKELFL